MHDYNSHGIFLYVSFKTIYDPDWKISGLDRGRNKVDFAVTSR